jgi:hypothetical protein
MIDHDLRQSDVYHFGEALSEARQIPRPVQPQTMVSGFLKNTESFLTPPNYEWLKATVDEIEKRGGVPRYNPDVDYGFSTNGSSPLSLNRRIRTRDRGRAARGG